MNKKPSNWIQGLSVEERKKRGIVTVMPDHNVDDRIHYDVGNVDVKINHSHMNKLRILKMTMENWAHDDGKSYALDSAQGRMYEADLHKVNDLLEKGTEQILEDKNKFLGDPNFLTKDEMLYLNELFKTYGGIRKVIETDF